MDGLGTDGEGVGGTDKGLQGVCLVGGMGGVGWLVAGSLHGAAPSRERLPREDSSFERANNPRIGMKRIFYINFFLNTLSDLSDLVFNMPVLILDMFVPSFDMFFC